MENNFKRIVSQARKRVKNRHKQLSFLEESLPPFQIKAIEAIASIAEVFNKPYSSYTLEIGFGDGDNLINAALSKETSGHIGCEVFTAGVVDTIKKIQIHNISNIKIWHDDAAKLIELLPDNSLDLVYILHPDPWPKQRHKKRRLITKGFLEAIAKKMAPCSKLLIITDHKDYAEQIEENVNLTNYIFDAIDDFPPIVKTKYRIKADALGIKSQYFCLKRKQ